MANEGLLHIKFERVEAIESRKNILECQIALLKILKRASSYKALKERESGSKESLNKKMRGLRNAFMRLEKALPRLKIQKIKDEEEKVKQKKQPKEDLTIESQLQEIQRRLEELQR